MANMSTVEDIGDKETDEGDSTSSTETFLRLSLNFLVDNLSPVAVKAGAVVDLVVPIVVRELKQWKSGLVIELQRYEERGNSRTTLLLTVLVLFLVAFHVELIQTCKALLRNGGLLEQWRFKWTLFYQAQQRQWRRRNRKKKENNTQNKTASKNGVTPKSLASPTSTASTVEDSNTFTNNVLNKDPNNTNNNAFRGRMLLMMKNHHKSISPRISPERPKVERDAYGNKITPTAADLYRNQSQSTKARAPSPITPRSASMDMRIHHVPDPNSTLLDSKQSFDSISNHQQTPNQSTSTIASKDTRSTNTNHTTRTPTSHSYTSSRASDYNSNRLRRSRAHLAQSTKLYAPPESAPSMRRAHTSAISGSSPSNSLNTSNGSRRMTKKNNLTSSAAGPLSNARRRMSAGGPNGAEPVPTATSRTHATPSRTKSTGTNVARKMHPRSRSGNGATTSTASQMYMARQPSQAAKAYDVKPTRRPSGGGGGASPMNAMGSPKHSNARGRRHSQSVTNTRSGRNLSPMRGKMTREPSREDLGYE